jgi:hypothetical protein
VARRRDSASRRGCAVRRADRLDESRDGRDPRPQPRVAQAATAICEHAAGYEQAAQQRRLAGLQRGTKAYRAELKQARLSADLLDVEACRP